MTITDASPIEEHQQTRPMSGRKKGLLIFAAGCGSMIVLLLGTCGISVAVGMFRAALPPQVVITYRGGNSDYMQLFAKNTSGKPITNAVVNARWGGLAAARAELHGTINPGEERSFELRAQIDESKLLSNPGVLDLYTRDQWEDLTNRQQERAVLRMAERKRATEEFNNRNLDLAFSKPPTIKVTTASGDEIRSNLIDTSKVAVRRF